MSAEPTITEKRLVRLPWTYQRRRFVGRVIGAVRVLLGKSASIPKGEHDTAIGRVSITDYYGGCIFSIKKPDERDLEILRRVGRPLSGVRGAGLKTEVTSVSVAGGQRSITGRPQWTRRG